MENPLELWHISAQASELREAQPEPLKENEVSVESVFSMVSQGTERIVCNGNVPDEAGEKMRVPHMKGFFSFPCTYGNSVVGMVMQGPDNLVGKLVHVVHPHKSLITVSQTEIYPVPGFIPAKRATLATNIETAITAIWDSGITAGDKVLIMGFGIIGALIAKLAVKIPGVEILILEKEQGRATIASSLGFNVLSTARRMGSNYDLAFNTSGTSRGLQACIDSLGPEGKVIETSWYGTDAVSIKLGMGFHYNRKKIISSHESHIPVSKALRWDVKRRKDLAFKLLRDESYDKLITQEVPFRDSPGFFKRLRNEDINDIGIVLSYR